MEKIKILQVGISSNLGGIEKYLINVHRNINHERYKIDYLVFKGKKVCFYEELINKSNIYEITHRKKNYIKYLKETKKFFKNSHYDYIHFHLMNFSCFEIILYAKKYTNAKIILHSHTSDPQKVNMKKRILNEIGLKLIKKQDIYLKTACSKKAGEYLFKNFKNNTFKVLNNGIHIEEFKFNEKNRNELRKKYNVQKSLVIGHIGRLSPQKNHFFLLEIFKEILKLRKDAILLMIGKGELNEKIEKKSMELNINKNIIHIENTNKINEYMSAMDIFVLPSLYEGLPIVLIEAQASGLQCFITNTLAEEIDITNNVKRISLNKSAEEWAKEIIKLNKNNMDRISINQKVEKSDFDIKKSIRILEKYYVDNLIEK